jgi:hypothetical protein
MSPEPWLRIQAAAACVLLIATVVLGGAVVALVFAGLLGLWGAGLWSKYRRDKGLVNVKAPPHRERLDLLVAGDARTALLPPLVLGVYALVTSSQALHAASFVLDAVATAAFVSVVVYGSSLVDWYLILPRLSGMLGPRPCRQDGDFETFPRTWREVTRWWYGHRIVADFVLVYGAALAAGMVVAGIAGASSPWMDFAFSAVFGTVGAYRKALGPAAKEWMHPRLVVGRTVSTRFGGRRYVFDIAIEGVQVVPAERFEERAEQMLADEGPEFERHPERVPLANVDEMGDGSPYAGCDRRCAGISWYCIENENCFKPK